MRTSNGTIYILSPANIQSGGVDALHQLTYYLNCLNKKAILVYKAQGNERKHIGVLDRYKPYINHFIFEDDIVDSPENIVVVTESYTKDRFRYKKARVFIWWLGINKSLTWTLWKKVFFLGTLPLRILNNWSYYKKRTFAIVKFVLNKECYSFKNELPNVLHMCASYYAFDYVSKRSCNEVYLCIEPISKLFLDVFSREKKIISKESRKNVILYNSARNYNSIIKKLAALDADLIFEPLQGLNQQQLIEKYRTSKLYIDFGAFPGAERIPKEAVLFGCAIITGKRGASGFYGDVPIPDEYKFGNPKEQIGEIVVKIRHILDNYENIYPDFDEYRQTVLNLEENFKKSLCAIFKNDKK